MEQTADAVKAGGRRMTIFGVIAIVLGILCLFTPLLTGFSILTFIGVFVFVAGVFRIIWAFTASKFSTGLVKFAIGLLTLLCGAALLGNPLFASGVLTIVIMIYLILDGVLELVAGLQRRAASGWGWLVFGGIVSILLGFLIWRQYPLSGAWAVGVFLGIKLFFVGLIMITAGSVARSLAK